MIDPFQSKFRFAFFIGAHRGGPQGYPNRLRIDRELFSDEAFKRMGRATGILFCNHEVESVIPEHPNEDM
jgi:hypothetical protein